ncbi:MAG: hypothetical protein JRI35_04900 [Deltaproteobacteria bacterium]|nr:hypothetical protein [Deltaproteobacteria bacterium]MBW1966328.1 hypothetical protein [Deltaproteobacteria bacterium]MBW2097310.1 hypothetical protein [Deltaproteobacteria bacterium]HDM78481.1 hypothetical protein [Deltaproteobacteria bacterium]
MSNFEKHLEKYEMFKHDATNDSVSIPLRIEAYFYAAFHLIEAVAARHGLHVEKHQRVRSFLVRHSEIMGDETEKVWQAFQEIENQLRPGQVYGGQVNGWKLRRARELFIVIEAVCQGILS